MKHTLNCTSGALLDTLIMVFEKKGFLRIGTKVFKVVGYRPGTGVLRLDCEFDLEDHREGQQADAMVILPADTSHVTVKPTPWNGPEDGLPPVGLEVEVLWSSTKREYVTGKVLAHDEDRAVFRFTSGERKGEYQADKPHSQHGAELPNFRPIRTAEQLAAEEREEAIREMNRVARSGTKPYLASTGMGGGCEALYDAGYRLVQP